MKATGLVLILFLAINLWAQNSKEQGFILTGNLSGFPDSTGVSLEDANTNKLIASGKIVKGKFVLKGKLDEPTLCWLKISGEAQKYIFVENKNMTVTGSKPVSGNFTVSGSPSHVDFREFENIFGPFIVKTQELAGTINNSPYGPMRDSLMNLYNANLDSVQKNIDRFLDKHPKSMVSPFMLLVTVQYFDDPVLLEKRYNRLDATVKNTPTGNSVKAYIDYNKVGAIGSNAVDFTQPDTSGNPVSLSSFKGKYVLVDFWASWCGPCRAENPNVVASFQKFKNKNFTVLGVSLDRPGQREAWLNAIHKDNLTWTHVSDLQFWNNAAAQLYKVSGIPFNFLVDPEGKIIARKLRGSDLDAKLCEVLGCN